MKRRVTVNGVSEQGEDGKWRFYVEIEGHEKGRLARYDRLDDPRSWDTREECEREGTAVVQAMMQDVKLSGLNPIRNEINPE